ncbi:DNA methyltransferase [Deinococcus sp. RL]|uniref:DNA adenine methylase n=1 Tax=Deinococcus sp. RL TaxID=1489678 RepID=UPI0004D88A03|nr:DNA adenine methylase [Deinococcus sp. RL]KEF34503.1 DNA methyltransferase [Deinococcus sp. RL]
MPTAQAPLLFSDLTHPVVNVAQVPQYSPFRYPGGKSWFVPRLRQWLASRERPAVFVEPFAGGGSISCAVALEGLADRVVMVELDDRVAAVWQTIFSEQAEMLAQRILSFDMTAEAAAEILASDPTDLLEVAWRTVVQNRVSRGGIIAPGSGVLKQGENGKGVLSRWYPDTLARRIRALNAVRERVTVICGDGLPVLAQYIGRRDVSAFVDPPYTAGGKRAGRRLYMHSVVDHPQLFQIAAALNDVVMTYDLSPEIFIMAKQNSFQVKPIRMKNTHHTIVHELLIGHDLSWEY